eukprot:2959307-Pyramimonas_sp.AAC.1
MCIRDRVPPRGRRGGWGVAGSRGQAWCPAAFRQTRQRRALAAAPSLPGAGTRTVAVEGGARMGRIRPRVADAGCR